MLAAISARCAVADNKTIYMQKILFVIVMLIICLVAITYSLHFWNQPFVTFLQRYTSVRDKTLYEAEKGFALSCESEFVPVTHSFFTRRALCGRRTPWNHRRECPKIRSRNQGSLHPTLLRFPAISIQNQHVQRSCVWSRNVFLFCRRCMHILNEHWRNNSEAISHCGNVGTNKNS